MVDLSMTNFIKTRCFNVKKHYLEREEGEKNVVFERTFLTKSNECLFKSFFHFLLNISKNNNLLFTNMHK